MKIHPSLAVVVSSALLALAVAGCMTQPAPQNSPLCGIVGEDGKPIPATFTGTTGVTNRGHAASHIVLVQKADPGCCAEFDRVVFQFEGLRLPTYRIQYVNGPIQHCASGNPVNVSGNAYLQVTMDTAQAHTEAGQSTIANANRKLNCANLKGLAETCDFEGKVQFVLGLNAKKAYRAVELQNPPRLVIDVKH